MIARRKALPKNFYEEEIRSDYLVSADMKKVWARELELLEYFDAFCRKHDLKYFMDYGTLLGAVRHQGFIPWDDDVDVSMFRDDYERMKQLAEKEIAAPYFLQTAYNDQMLFEFAKLKDSRTTAIEFLNFDASCNQGIFIDITPLDNVPASTEETTVIFEAEKELLQILTQPRTLLERMQREEETVFDYDVLIQLLKLSPRQVFEQYENFCLEHLGESDYYDVVTSRIRAPKAPRLGEWYRETVYLPFEHLMLPAPIEYEKVLDCAFYGSWREFPENKARHIAFFDAEKPYTYYMEHKELIPAEYVRDLSGR